MCHGAKCCSLSQFNKIIFKKKSKSPYSIRVFSISLTPKFPVVLQTCNVLDFIRGCALGWALRLYPTKCSKKMDRRVSVTASLVCPMVNGTASVVAVIVLLLRLTIFPHYIIIILISIILCSIVFSKNFLYSGLV